MDIDHPGNNNNNSDQTDFSSHSDFHRPPKVEQGYQNHDVLDPHLENPKSSSSASTSTANTPITKRACDSCHRRKVRCDGKFPCANCIHASLVCTYNKIPQKKGPKGSRAKVLSELRKTQDLANAFASASTSSGSLSGHVGKLSLSTPNALPSPTIQSPTSAPTTRVSEYLTPEFIEACYDGFFAKMYGTLPIINRSWLDATHDGIISSIEKFCFVSSVCAFMVSQPGVSQGPSHLSLSTAHQSPHVKARNLLEDACRARSAIELGEDPSILSLLTSFFISATYFQLDKQNSAWFYLQEAILLAKVMRIHNEKSYELASPDNDWYRRTFWVLFVSERAQALQRHRDLTLHATVSLPAGEQSDLAVQGLIYLYKLFQVVDDGISEIWNALRADTPIIWPGGTAEWLADKQIHLANALPEILNLTENQQADLYTTKSWLQTIIWQLSTASQSLSSNNPNRAMMLDFPIEIARSLCEVTGRLSKESLEVHGVGLVEKLFDVSCALVDVMTIVPVPITQSPSPSDFLIHLVNLISTLRHGETKFVRLIHQKISESLPGFDVTHFRPVAQAHFNPNIPVLTPPIPRSDESTPSFDSSSLAMPGAGAPAPGMMHQHQHNSAPSSGYSTPSGESMALPLSVSDLNLHSGHHGHAHAHMYHHHRQAPTSGTSIPPSIRTDLLLPQGGVGSVSMPSSPRALETYRAGSIASLSPTGQPTSGGLQGGSLQGGSLQGSAQTFDPRPSTASSHGTLSEYDFTPRSGVGVVGHMSPAYGILHGQRALSGGGGIGAGEEFFGPGRVRTGERGVPPRRSTGEWT